jgi:hypothetical protein
MSDRRVRINAEDQTISFWWEEEEYITLTWECVNELFYLIEDERGIEKRNKENKE